jgi:hypothetical protein
MRTFKRGAMALFLVTGLVLSVGSAARAANRVFLSTSLEASQASYILDFSPATGGIVDKLRLAFPAGMLGSGVELRDLLIDGKVAKQPIVITLDPADPNALFVDVRLTAIIRSGTPVVLELMGITNPVAGDYQVGIELIGKLGNVVEALPPIAFTVDPLGSGSGGTGDITGVTAGTGLTGGGTSGGVTLSVDTSQTQKRVSGTCTTGNAVRVVNQDGTVTCQAVGTGTVTSVASGTGLTGGPITSTGTLSVATGGITGSLLASNSVDSSKIVDGSIGLADVNATQIQARVSGSCTAGNAIRAIDSAGAVTCETAGGGGGGWTDDGATVRLTTSTDNVGIGTTSPATGVKFHIVSGAGAVSPPRLESSNANGFASGWDFYLGSTAKGYVGVPGPTAVPGGGEMLLFGSTSTKASIWTNGTRALTVDTSGNVGIGTASPVGRVEVEGPSGPLLHLNHTGSTGTSSLWFSQDGTNTAKFSLERSGTFELEVNPQLGSALIVTTSTNRAQFGGDVLLSASKAFLLGSSPPALGNPVGACVDANDFNHKLGLCSSSLRYKDNPQNFTGGLDIVNRLRSISFTWKGDNGGADIGLAAEEVAEIEPLLTFRNDKGEIEGVRYNQLSAVFINAFKDQQAQIEQQRALNEQQQEELRFHQRENRELKARLEALERLVNERAPRTVSTSVTR